MKIPYSLKLTRFIFPALAFLSLALTTPSFLQAEALFNEELRDGSLPAGWSQTDVTFATAAGGYANFTSLSAVLTTPTFDASAFAEVRVEFQVAKFGSGGDGPITVEYSLNSGDDWVSAGDSPTPTGSTYLAADLLIENVSSTMQIRFTRPGSPSQKRLRDVVITGEGTAPPPGQPFLATTPSSLSGFEYILDGGPSVPQSFALSGENLDGTDVVVTAPSSFSIATSESGTYGSSVTLAAFDGSSATLWIRLNDGLSAGHYAGEITSTGGDAASISLNLSGEVTPPPPALTDFGAPNAYAEDFSGFVSTETIPVGWTVSNETYNGDWGSGFSAGLRGNDNVLGFQHTGTTGVFTVTLTVENQTGETIEALNVSYIGRVARPTEARSPEWTVVIDGETVGDLAYTTASGVDEVKSALVGGLSIAEGETVTITWSSSGDVGTSGSRRQIGISDFAVFAVEAGSPALERNPSSLGGFGYVEGMGPSDPQTFTVSGENLDGTDVMVSADNFEFSLSESSAYTNPLVLEAFDGEETIIYARMVAGLDVGSIAESASIGGGGASNRDLSLSGTVILPAPVLSSGAPVYGLDFSSFGSIADLPTGWTVSDTSYAGDWGTGTGAGLRGNDSVLGYQHTGGTGVFTATLSILNDTGETINALDISYLGRVERDDQNRFPEWTVSVNGVIQEGLFYSTEGKTADVDTLVEALATGFSVADGEFIQITWSSERGEGDGASRQIGIGAVTVEVAEVQIFPPVFSVSSGFYRTAQTVFVTNFREFPQGTEAFYTLDGSPPSSQSFPYDNAVGITVSTGGVGGTVTLQAIAFESGVESVVTSATYEFPVKVSSIEELRQQQTGSTPIQVNNPAVFTGGTSFRNTKFFQDDSGFGIQIDDPAGVITTTYEPGDQIDSMYGTLTSFQGQLQFVPLEDFGEPTNTGVEVEPVVRSLNELSSDDQALLVAVFGISFVEADGENTFEGGGSQEGLIDITDPSITGLFRNIFGDSDITGSLIPEDPVTLTGIIQERSDGLTIGPRNLADIEPFEGIPVITSTLTAIGTFGEPFSYTIEATEEPEIFGADNLPAGLSLDSASGIISGSPAEASATPFAVELSASTVDGVTGTALLELTILRAPQAIAFSPLTDRSAGDADFEITASATSGLPVSFLIDGPAELVGGSESPATISLTGAEGLVTITALQEGDDNYLPAEEVVQEFSVSAEEGNRYRWEGPEGDRLLSETTVQTLFTIIVPDSGLIESVSVELEMTHPWPNDFFSKTEVKLRAPEGTGGPGGRAEALLFPRGDRENNIDEVFTPSFSPEIIGQEMNGEWTLVIDQEFGDGGLGPGQLESFVLVITEQESTLSPLEQFLEALPEGVNGLTDDASGDGMSNLLTFALGGDPESSNVRLLPQPLLDGEGGFSLIFLRRAAGQVGSGNVFWESEGLSYQIEFSPDLSDQSWEAIPVTVTVTDSQAPEGYEEIEVVPSIPEQSSSRAFLRLQVTTVP